MELHLSFGGEGGFAVAVAPRAYQKLQRDRYVLLGPDDSRDALYAPHGWVVVAGGHLVWATGRRGGGQPVAATRKPRDFGALPQVALRVGEANGRTVTFEADTRKAG